MNRPWMPLYVGDYLGDTGHLTTTQHGAYLLLMMHYWRKGELPDDDKQLSAITKLPLKVWQEYRETLQAFFYDGWQHKRIDAELAKMLRVSHKRAIAGQLGGNCSALNRMKLENAANGKTGKTHFNSVSASTYKNAWLNGGHDKSLITNDVGQAIAKQSCSKGAAIVDHSHSQSKKEEACKGGIAVSPELLASIARKQ